MSESKGIIEQCRERLFRSPVMWKLVLVLAGGVFMMVYAGNWLSPQTQPVSSNVDQDGEQEAEAKSEGDDSISAAEKELEGRLEKVLSSVAGCGDVQATVTMAAGPEYQYAKNLSEQTKTIEENDQSGGKRTTTEANEEGDLALVRAVTGGKEEPVLIMAKRPEIAGVLVLAEGAGDPGLREELVRAVVTVLAVPAHKVTVLPKEGG